MGNFMQPVFAVIFLLTILTAEVRNSRLRAVVEQKEQLRQFSL